MRKSGYDENGNMTQMLSPGASENLTYSVDDRLALCQ